MELLLLLLIVFLQLGGRWGGAGVGVGYQHTGDRGPQSNPSPVVTGLLEAEVGSLTGVVKGTPCREMPALLSLL